MENYTTRLIELNDRIRDLEDALRHQANVRSRRPTRMGSKLYLVVPVLRLTGRIPPKGVIGIKTRDEDTMKKKR